MTPQEFTAFRKRLGWSLVTLSQQIDITPSRLADYETGRTRGKNSRPAPIPKVVELACRWLEHEEVRQRPLTTAERAALWGDDQGWPLAAPGPAVVDDREAIYEPDRGTAPEAGPDARRATNVG